MPHIKSQKQKRYEAREYMRRINYLKKDREQLGTYDTHFTFQQYKPESIARDKDGNPDFEQEEKCVRYLKIMTFRRSKYGGKKTQNEGDIIRGY